MKEQLLLQIDLVRLDINDVNIFYWFVMLSIFTVTSIFLVDFCMGSRSTAASQLWGQSSTLSSGSPVVEFDMFTPSGCGYFTRSVSTVITRAIKLKLFTLCTQILHRFTELPEITLVHKFHLIIHLIFTPLYHFIHSTANNYFISCSTLLS